MENFALEFTIKFFPRAENFFPLRRVQKDFASIVSETLENEELAEQKSLVACIDYAYCSDQDLFAV